MQSENTKKTSSDDMVIDIYKYTNPIKYDTRSVLIYNNRAWHVEDGLEEFEHALHIFAQGGGWNPFDRMDKLTFIETISKDTHPHYFI